DRPVTREVPDPAQVGALRLDAETGERRDRAGHQAFAAGLVDRPGPLVPDRDVEPGPGGVQRGGQAARPAADDQQVLHGCTCSPTPSAAVLPNTAIARSSVRMRTARSAELA